MQRACYDNSTSNLTNHVRMCNAGRPKDQGTIVHFAHGSTYTPERLRVLLDLWVATSSRPYSLVNDAGFQQILRMFHQNVAIPSESTISRDVKEIYSICRENLAAFIEVRGCFALSTLARAHSFVENSWCQAYRFRWLDITQLLLFHWPSPLHRLPGQDKAHPLRLHSYRRWPFWSRDCGEGACYACCLPT